MSVIPLPPGLRPGGAAIIEDGLELSSDNSLRDQSQVSKWRARIGVHPAADEFPEMSEAELLELGKDIDANGLQQPIILFCEKARRHRRGFLVPDGEVVVLDGRNRLTAMELVGLELFDEGGYLAPDVECRGDRRVKTVYGKIPLTKDAWRPEVEPYSYALSANAHRRHLKPEKKRELIDTLLKAKPEKSDRQIAAIVKASHHTVASRRELAEARGQIAHVETRTDSVGRQQPAKKRRSEDVDRTPAWVLPHQRLIRMCSTFDGFLEYAGDIFTNTPKECDSALLYPETDPERKLAWGFIKALQGIQLVTKALEEKYSDKPERAEAASSTENTDHVEREYTNLITVWNNSADPERARFLKAIGGSHVEPIADRKDAIRVFDDAVALVEQRHAEIRALPMWQRIQRIRRAMDALGVSNNDLIPGAGR